jgi:hypothetical protein
VYKQMQTLGEGFALAEFVDFQGSCGWISEATQALVCTFLVRPFIYMGNCLLNSSLSLSC